MHSCLVSVALLLCLSPGLASAAPAAKPTIILVHGAFAGSSTWNGVIVDLMRDGYRVVAAVVPRRSLTGDADYVTSLAASLARPVVLVGHSYGGKVISVAAVGRPNVKAMVFVAGLAPDIGESAASLDARFPTGTMAGALAPPVPLSGGGADLYIHRDKYWQQFAADVPKAAAVQMAATQRPIVQTALAEPAMAQSWRNLPSWFVRGQGDRNSPAALHAFMAKRAGAREAFEVPAASHVVMISHLHLLSAMIERAAAGDRPKVQPAGVSQ